MNKGRNIIYFAGGGMSGVFGAGVCETLISHDLHGEFDEVYGSSAGAFNAAYFLAKQAEGADIYSKHLRNGFLFPSRLLSEFPKVFLQRFGFSTEPRPIMDLNYLVEVVKSVVPLDVSALQRSSSEFFIKVMNRGTGNIEYLNGKQNTFEALRFSASLPPYCFPNGQSHIDSEVRSSIGLEDLTTKLGPRDRLVIVLNKPLNPGGLFTARNLFNGVLSEFVIPDLPMYRYFREKSRVFREDVANALVDKRICLVHPPEGFSVRPGTTNVKKLEEARTIGRMAGYGVCRFLEISSP